MKDADKCMAYAVAFAVLGIVLAWAGFTLWFALPPAWLSGFSACLALWHYALDRRDARHG